MRAEELITLDKTDGAQLIEATGPWYAHLQPDVNVMCFGSTHQENY